MNEQNQKPFAYQTYTPFQLLKTFFESEHKFYAYFFSAVIFVMTIVLVSFDLFFSYWSNYFYDALQAYDKKRVFILLAVFFVLATINIIIAVYRYYISQLFSLKWRTWLTKQFITRWLAKRDFYYLELFDRHTDNPDQRIQEDVGALVDATISLVIGFVIAVTTLFAFIYVLWTLSGVLTISLGQYGTLRVNGYLVWIAILYSLIGTWFTFKIGKPLVMLNFEQQRREASFRYAGTDTRINSEVIALYQGEEHQKNILQRLLMMAIDNKLLIILRQKLLLWFTQGYNQASVALPLLVSMPNYFNKVFKLGGLVQSLGAFAKVKDSLSFFVDAFTSIAEWRAIMQRLTTFLNHLNEIDHSVMQYNKLNIKKTGDDIHVRDLEITMPNQTKMLGKVNESFMHGQNYLIKGASGLGKSTFLRVLAGIWPYAAGELVLPANKEVMFLSQRPYMPIGTLAEALLFPDYSLKEHEQDLPTVLKLSRLEKFISRLNEVAPWAEELSPGEQQRVAFARVLLHKPQWVFLDESTSMLDPDNEAYLYELMKKELPGCSIVSVAHRMTLDGYHDRIVDLNRYSS